MPPCPHPPVPAECRTPCSYSECECENKAWGRVRVCVYECDRPRLADSQEVARGHTPPECDSGLSAKCLFFLVQPRPFDADSRRTDPEQSQRQLALKRGPGPSPAGRVTGSVSVTPGPGGGRRATGVPVCIVLFARFRGFFHVLGYQFHVLTF